MPTYQYACTACDEQLEVVQSFSDSALTACPACEGRLRKVYGAVGVVFKGSGFYKTDSRSEGKKAGAAASSGESSAGSSGGSGEGSSTPAKAEGKGDSSSTPAAKTETKSAPAAPAAKSA